MNLKMLLPWICVLGLSAGAAAVFVSSQKKDTELARLRDENLQFQQFRAELEEAQAQAKRQTQQIAELRKDNQELLRLRSEVSQLRGEKQQLSKQIQTAQSQVELAQSQAAQALKSGASKAEEVARLQAEVEARRKLAEQAQQNALARCVNNLRQLDAAKQQWALEHNRTVDSIPTPQELAPYLVIPVCPAGGAYTLNAVNSKPTCSIPGHVLP